MLQHVSGLGGIVDFYNVFYKFDVEPSTSERYCIIWIWNEWIELEPGIVHVKKVMFVCFVAPKYRNDLENFTP